MVEMAERKFHEDATSAHTGGYRLEALKLIDSHAGQDFQKDVKRSLVAVGLMGAAGLVGLSVVIKLTKYFIKNP